MSGLPHTVTWDHGTCDHSDDPDDHYCRPRAHTITCPDPACGHRRQPDPAHRDDYAEGWWFCQGYCIENDSPHADTGGPHTNLGHLIVLGECNAVAWLGAEDYPDPANGEIRDGDILVEWTGDYYEWTYA